MAHSFYHGYLKLILPCTGDERKGLIEQINDYEAKNDVHFPSKKLYILIPLSAHCPTTIKERSGIEMDSGEVSTILTECHVCLLQNIVHCNCRVWTGDEWTELESKIVNIIIRSIRYGLEKITNVNLCMFVLNMLLHFLHFMK